MRSLRRRLNLGLAAILVVIFSAHWLAADWVIRYVAEKQMATRLEHDGDSLLSTLAIDSAGRLRCNANHVGLVYEQPFSGHYFAVESSAGGFYSPSLGGESLAVQPAGLGRPYLYHAPGPKGQPLLMLTRAFRRQGYFIGLSVGEDLTDIGRAIMRLRLAYLAVTVVVLIVAILSQSADVRRALRPLSTVRGQLQEVARGQRSRIDAEAPEEIQPLVDEFNRLLVLVERRLQQSRTAIGNLAHALKTPLAVLFRVASDPCLAEQPGLGERLREHAAIIHDRIERELKWARLNGTRQSGAGFNPRAELTALAGLLGAIHEGKNLRIELDVPDRVLPYDREDMLELIGNLADNACKWAAARVLIGVDCDAGYFAARVADDGPGCPEEALPSLTRRGLRLDESRSGHGLGLSIVHDIVEFYAGSIEFGRSAGLGGLEVNIRLGA